jgi:HD-like signal output (HDOD) protein
MAFFKRKQSVADSPSEAALAERTGLDSPPLGTQQSDAQQHSAAPPDLFPRLQASNQLASPSSVAGQLLALLGRDASAQEVADVVGTDADLTAELLQFLGSSLTRLPHQPASLADAVAAIGSPNAQLVALALALVPRERRSGAAGFDYARFRSQSLACAIAACAIAQHTNSYRPEVAFAAGLLSRIGRLALATGLPDEYEPVLQKAAERGDLTAAEHDILHPSHTQWGARLLHEWRLPAELCEAVAEFDQVTPASHMTHSSPLTTILHVADLVSQSIFSKESPKQTHERILGAAEFFLRLDEQSWAPLFDEITSQWKALTQKPAGPNGPTASHAQPPRTPARLSPSRTRLQEPAAQARTVKGLGGLRPQTAPPPAPEPSTAEPESRSAFLPAAPQSLQEAGLTHDDVELLICKLLLAKGSHAGRAIAAHLGLPFVVVEELLTTLKNDLILAYKNSAPFNDYEYELTDTGRERARRYLEECTYFGTAPVPLRDYIAGVEAQSLTAYRVGEQEVREAFQDLCICDNTLRRIGRAVNSGRGMFLYGCPGNGKTSIAERITGCFGTEIWIPRTLTVDGEILRLFDPAKHDEVEQGDEASLQEQRIDRRWVKVRRPTIVAGGELTMNELEVQHNPVTRVSEAPLQLKSNCGALVIDDFGRQRISTDQLLNRWIVPLEKRHDFLNLANGKKVQVPFDQLIIFSTNLEPRDLVDEAFLRRIPYKVQVHDPTPEEFASIFDMTRTKLGFPENSDAFAYLMDRHYQQAGRPLRCCHPRDLLLQVRNDCAFRDTPLELSRDALDAAIEDYFAIM